LFENELKTLFVLLSAEKFLASGSGGKNEEFEEKDEFSDFSFFFGIFILIFSPALRLKSLEGLEMLKSTPFEA
jgi:hypothetical protein